ncbi:MAG: hypothetical protein LBI69_00550 [Puniceicoccales bacterium]|jgi:sulfite reductase (NADPH) flavoprotein alpha-component|nr:hypothetical protein [Puniceicoccales bacterium]
MAYNRENPLTARLAFRKKVSRDGSDKDVFSIGLDTGGKLNYAPGDWLAVLPKNSDESVCRFLKFLNQKTMKISGVPVREIVQKYVCVSEVPGKLGMWMLENNVREDMRGSLEAWIAGDFKKVVKKYDVCDFLEKFLDHPPKPKEILPRLRKLHPRLYSIASSTLKDPNIVELLIASAYRERIGGRVSPGVASSWLNEHLPIGDPIDVFSITTPFKLSKDLDNDILCIGPGVGLAPFLGFFQHRKFFKKRGSSLGRCWLFFGNRHRASDFLFEEDLNHYQNIGVLDRMDLAFSRDQPEKIYVQDRILEHGEEIWQWIHGGASIYVCGSATPMAIDVEAALRKVVEIHGNFSEEDAKKYISNMYKNRHYFRDIY